MKKFTLAITILILTAAAACAAPVTLRYKTSPGDLFYFADASETVGSIKFTTAQGELLNAIPINRKSTTSTRMDTVSVEDGAATIHITVEKYKLTDYGAAVMEYDREKGIEKPEGMEEDLDFLDPYAMTIDERGSVLGFEKQAKKKDRKNDEFDWKKLSTVMQILFPEEPIDVGEEWVSMVSMVGEPSQYDIINVTRQFKLLGFEEVKGLDCAKIRFRITIENAKGVAQELIDTFPPDADAKVESTSLSVDSDVYFAHAEGVLVAIEAETILKVALTITAPVDGRDERVNVEGFFKTESVYELE